MLDRLAFGEIAKKHHVALRDSEGRLRHEECLTRNGFSGPYTILYHDRRPHTQHATETTHGFSAPASAGELRLAKRHYKSFEIVGASGPMLDARVPLLFNEDVVVALAQPTVADPTYFANADGDDLHYVYEGSGLLRTLLGDLRYEAGDYVCVPRGILHRFVPDEGLVHRVLTIECRGGVSLLSQFRNDVGQLTMDAPYSHRDFRRPEFVGPVDEGLRDLVVKRGDAFHGFRYDDSPLDVVGWDGTVYPWAFPILAFQPRAGLVHLPPTLHGTFATRGALICSFVPRLLDFHPEAIPCPYPHSSVDVDELIFYCRGNFTSRKGVGPGSISHHPAGVAHGPHPGAYEASVGVERTDELAVMLDCQNPLHATTAALAVEDAGYQESFV